MAQREQWEDLRAEIEDIVTESNIAPADCKALAVHGEWQKIEENI